MPVTAKMVRTQLRLAGRSAKVLARHPGTGRELPRLAATRGRSTMKLRLPWLPFRLIDELAAVIGPGSRVFEYGGGGSTLWFLDRGADVITVEHHDGWADELERSIDSPRWTLLRRSPDADYADYVAAIDDRPDDSLDLVVVDGRERARCAARATAKVRPGGLLLVDDIDRERYHAAVDGIGWPRRDVVGFAPAKPTLAYTAVLRRPPST